MSAVFVPVQGERRAKRGRGGRHGLGVAIRENREARRPPLQEARELQGEAFLPIGDVIASHVELGQSRDLEEAEADRLEVVVWRAEGLEGWERFIVEPEEGLEVVVAEVEDLERLAEGGKAGGNLLQGVGAKVEVRQQRQRGVGDDPREVVEAVRGKAQLPEAGQAQALGPRQQAQRLTGPPLEAGHVPVAEVPAAEPRELDDITQLRGGLAGEGRRMRVGHCRRRRSSRAGGGGGGDTAAAAAATTTTTTRSSSTSAAPELGREVELLEARQGGGKRGEAVLECV